MFHSFHDDHGCTLGPVQRGVRSAAGHVATAAQEAVCLCVALLHHAAGGAAGGAVLVVCRRASCSVLGLVGVGCFGGS